MNKYICIYIYIYMCVCVCVCVCGEREKLSSYNAYNRRKWTLSQEFKPWTRLCVFHIALISLGKVLI